MFAARTARITIEQGTVGLTGRISGSTFIPKSIYTRYIAAAGLPGRPFQVVINQKEQRVSSYRFITGNDTSVISTIIDKNTRSGIGITCGHHQRGNQCSANETGGFQPQAAQCGRLGRNPSGRRFSLGLGIFLNSSPSVGARIPNNAIGFMLHYLVV